MVINHETAYTILDCCCFTLVSIYKIELYCFILEPMYKKKTIKRQQGMIKFDNYYKDKTLTSKSGRSGALVSGPVKVVCLVLNPATDVIGLKVTSSAHPLIRSIITVGVEVTFSGKNQVLFRISENVQSTS